MKVEDIQVAIRVDPFEPFLIHTRAGESYPVRHPETIAVSPDVSVIGLIHGPGRVALIDIEDITEIVEESQARQTPEGDPA